MADRQVDCDNCPEHSGTQERLKAVEDDMTIVKTNTAIVNKLSTRVGMLITIMSIGTLTVLAGTIYTFTAIAQFKGDYAEHRVDLIDKMNTAQNETVEKLGDKIADSERRIDNRLDDLSTKIAKLEATVGNSP